jgi:hypothetical protein
MLFASTLNRDAVWRHQLGHATMLTPPLLLVGVLGVPDATPQRRAYVGCHGVAPPQPTTVARRAATMRRQAVQC